MGIRQYSEKEMNLRKLLQKGLCIFGKGLESRGRFLDEMGAFLLKMRLQLALNVVAM